MIKYYTWLPRKSNLYLMRFGVIILEEMHFKHAEPILFQRAPEPFGYTTTPVTDGPVEIYEGPDLEMYEKVSGWIIEDRKRHEDTREETSQTLQVSQVWAGESYKPELLREGIKEKTFLQQFHIRFRDRRFHSGSSVTYTPSITIAQSDTGKETEPGRITVASSGKGVKALIIDQKDNRPVIGKLVTDGVVMGARVGQYCSLEGRGEISGDYIVIDQGVVVTYTRWDNLPFIDGEWVHVGGISPGLLEAIERKEWERRSEEFFSRRWWWFW